MFDFDFNWDDSLKLGIDDLDIQRKEFFRIGRDIEQLLFIRCIGVTSEEIMNILYSLRDFITYHFYQEEIFMKSNNYPDIDYHVEKHEEFKNYINHLDYTMLCESPLIELKKLRDTIVDWVFGHMALADMEIKSYYNSLHIDSMNI